MAPPFIVSIRSGNFGSWKNAMYQDLRICRQCFSAARKHSGWGSIYAATYRRVGTEVLLDRAPPSILYRGGCGVNSLTSDFFNTIRRKLTSLLM